MNVKQAASFVRTLLKLLGAYLASKGHLEASGIQEFVGGGMVICGIIWSHVTHADGKDADGWPDGATASAGVIGWVLICGLCSAFAACLLMGCAGFRKTVVTTDVNGITTTNTVFDASKLAPIAKRLAKEGTRLPLIEHPEWRKEYVKAVVDLKALEARDTIDLSLLTEIVNRIPASELNSQEARLAIEGGETVLEIVDGVLEANGKTIPLDRVNDVRAVVTALRQGVEEGLAAAPTQ